MSRSRDELPCSELLRPSLNRNEGPVETAAQVQVVLQCQTEAPAQVVLQSQTVVPAQVVSQSQTEAPTQVVSQSLKSYSEDARFSPNEDTNNTKRNVCCPGLGSSDGEREQAVNIHDIAVCQNELGNVKDIHPASYESPKPLEQSYVTINTDCKNRNPLSSDEVQQELGGSDSTYGDDSSSARQQAPACSGQQTGNPSACGGCESCLHVDSAIRRATAARPGGGEMAGPAGRTRARSRPVQPGGVPLMTEACHGPAGQLPVQTATTARKGAAARKAGERRPSAADSAGDDMASRDQLTIGTVLMSGSLLRYRCASCPETFRSGAGLREHYADHEQLETAAREPPGQAGEPHVKLETESDEEAPWAPGRRGAARPKHACELCGKVLTSATKLTLHRRWHTGERPHGCRYCPKRCNDRYNLKRHEQLHFKKRPFGCATCGITFKTQLRLDAHRCRQAAAAGEAGGGEGEEGAPVEASEGENEEATGKEEGVVSMKDAVLERVPATDPAAADGALPDREANPHSGLMPLVPRVCDLCGRRLLTLSGWQRHQRIHANGLAHPCRYCDRRCNDKGNLRKHEATHFKKRLYSCATCDITFNSPWRFSQHVCKLGPPPEAESAPAPAPAASESPPGHQGSDPSLPSLPEPPRLPRGRQGAPSDRKQQRRHHVCPVCGKAMLSHASLEGHYRTHTGEKPFQCADCGKRFCNQGNLVVHMRTHTGERPYQCEECGKTFMYINHFKVHCRTHSGARPYSCRHCGKAFAASSSRRTHEETVHTEERKFICEACGAGFKEKKHLKRHSVRKHQAENGMMFA